MTGQQLRKAAHDGDTAKVSTPLSTQGAQSFINYDDPQRSSSTPLHSAAAAGRYGKKLEKETPLLGRLVVINGLVAKPELNGRTGRL